MEGDGETMDFILHPHEQKEERRAVIKRVSLLILVDDARLLQLN